MADQVASYYDNGQPATWTEAGTGKPYTMGMVNGKPTGKKVYLSPRAVDPHSTDLGPWKPGLLGGGSQWNADTGNYEKKSNTLEKITLAAAMAPFAAAGAGAVGGGSAAPASGASATSAPAISAPASWLPEASSGILPSAAAPAAAATSAAAAPAAAAMPSLSAPASWLPASTMMPSASAALPVSAGTNAGISAVQGMGMSDAVPGAGAVSGVGAPAAAAAAPTSFLGRTEGLLKSKGASIVGGALNSFLQNRQKNKELALEESKLDPYRAQMHQAQDATKLDYMANADFSSPPVRQAGQLTPPQSMMTWNPSPETRAAVRAALATVRRGK